MEIINDIIASIRQTARNAAEHEEYPTCPGIYSFVLAGNSTLKNFGKNGQIIYVGIAKESLKQRDLNTHFKTGSTGHSTLRRSIGAVLKQELKLTALTRNGTTVKRAIDHYRFDLDGDIRLSDWMQENLRIGFWEDHNRLPYKTLRDMEEAITRELKPTLDLDNRTRKYNHLATLLLSLREFAKRRLIQTLKLILFYKRTFVLILSSKTGAV